MIKSKVIGIFKSFNTKELRLFGDFVTSPFFNKNEKLIKLYEELKKEYPGFKSRSFTKENVFQKIYPGKKYKDNELRRSFSGLLELCEKFLVQINLSDSNPAYNLLFITELFTRKIDRLFDIKFKELTELYKDYNDVDDVFFKNKYDLEIIRKNINTSDEGGKVLYNIDNIFKYLVAYSTIAGLKLSQDINVLRKKMNIDYSNSLINNYFENFNFNSFFNDIKKADEKLYIIIRIYYLRHLIALGLDKDDSNYNELKNLIYDNLKIFSRREKFNLGIFLENSISEKLKEGKMFFQDEAHKINELRIREGIIKFDENDYLGINIFRKILETSLKLNKKDWAVKFIEDYSNELPPQTVVNVQNYSYSILSFSSGDYKKALELIARVNKYYDYNFEFAAKSVRLKCLYELGYIEDVFYSVDSYEHSLKNNRNLPEFSKINFKNFIYYIEKCAKLKTEYNIAGKELEYVNDAILKIDRILEKEWLIEKLNDLKK
jgi:hypothetical protein